MLCRLPVDAFPETLVWLLLVSTCLEAVCGILVSHVRVYGDFLGHASHLFLVASEQFCAWAYQPSRCARPVAELLPFLGDVVFCLQVV